MKKISYIIISTILVISPVSASDDSKEESIFEWEASYIGDASRNFNGGIKKGNTLMGVLALGCRVTTGKFWEGGEFYFQSMSTHGKGLSAYYIGDQQYISGIENGNYLFFLEKLYYRQNYKGGWVTLGLQDLNQDFLVCEGGGHFKGSSFGTPSTYPLNFAAPIYPKTALALSGMYNFTEKLSIKGAIFDGNCGSLEKDKTNIKWRLHTHEGFLLIGELAYTPDERLEIKGGGMYHTAHFPDPADSTKLYKGMYGMHLIVDYRIIMGQNRHIGFFAQINYHPSKGTFNPLYLGSGVVFQGILFNRTSDHLGIGIACARFFDHSSECDIECNYSVYLHRHITLIPSLHYIINPGGQRADIANATAGILRVIISR